MQIEPFAIDVADEVLTDLRARIRRTRWPDPSPSDAWEQGTDLGYLQALLAYWADGFDWRAQERRLNAFEQHRAHVDGVSIHFVRARAPGGGGLPLLLTHGWPSTFVEMLPLVPLLTDPHSHGIDAAPFDVVVPSLPGYGFSERPHRTGVTTRDTAGLWHRLMSVLGYHRYGAHGTDFGAGVTTFLALDHPNAVVGIHLSNLENAPYTGGGTPPLSAEERDWLAQAREWDEREAGYKAIQSTRPQTLGYGLNDSPAGLAAWVLDKWRSWSDSDGDLDATFSRDVLLTTLTIFWVTQTITSSMRDYVDNRTTGYVLGPGEHVDVPTGIAVFAHHHVPDPPPPLAWAERLYRVARWSEMPAGGHFAATEQPELLARDIAAFFSRL